MADETKSKAEKVFEQAKEKLSSAKLSERLQAARDVDVTHGGAEGAKHVLKTFTNDRVNLTEVAASAKKNHDPSASWSAVASAITAAGSHPAGTSGDDNDAKKEQRKQEQLEASAPSEKDLAKINVLDTDDSLDFTNLASADARAIHLITTPDPILGKE